jgi:hypothetical protein
MLENSIQYWSSAQNRATHDGGFSRCFGLVKRLSGPVQSHSHALSLGRTFNHEIKRADQEQRDRDENQNRYAE